MVGDEIEKTRIEYVQQLEQELRRVCTERDEFKAIAEKYEISVRFSQGINESNHSVLQAAFSFGKQMFTINVSAEKINYYKDDPIGLLQVIVASALTQLINTVVVENNTEDFIRVTKNMNNLFERGLIK